MNLWKKIAVSMLAMGVVAGIVVASSKMPSGPTLNELAPDFEAVDSNGVKHKLSSFRGKVVVLEWKNHECPFVVKHYSEGNMQSLQKYARDNGAVWLSIVSSAPGKQGYLSDADANALVKKEKSNADAVLQDVTGKVGRLYAAKVTPHMFIIDKEGKLVYDGAIDDKRSANPKDIANSRPYVKENLALLFAGRPVVEQKTTPYGCGVKY